MINRVWFSIGFAAMIGDFAIFLVGFFGGILVDRHTLRGILEVFQIPGLALGVVTG